MSWTVPFNVGTPRRPTQRQVDLDPLPSGMAQAVILVRAPRAVSVQRAILRALYDTSRPGQPPRPRSPRAVLQIVRGARADAPWCLIGPLPYGGRLYVDLLARVTRRDARRRQDMRARGQLFVLDPRTGAELPFEAPQGPAGHAPDLAPDADDEQRALELGSEAG